jgi:hypothetical protein
VKHAAREHIRHKIIHISWHLEQVEREADFLRSIKVEENVNSQMTESEMDFFTHLLAVRGLPALKDDKDYFETVFAEELENFDIACKQYEQITNYAEKRVAPFANGSDTDAFLNDGSRSDVGSDDNSSVNEKQDV